jgi:hypothetical protein
MTKLALLGAMLVLTVCIGGCGDSGRDQPATYKVTVSEAWPKVVDEKEVDGYIESAWRDPVGPTVTINTRLASETGSPMANAQLARLQTSKLPGYHERGMKWVKVGGRPVVHWAFDMPEEEARIEYFFEECETTFILRGTTNLFGFEAYSEDYRAYTASIKPECDE